MSNTIDYPILYEGNENYFFISYSHHSKTDVYRILRKLNSLGVRFWYDKGLEKGVDWEKHVHEKMQKSSCVLFFFDANFFTSQSLQKEVRIVSETPLKFCPVYYEGLVYQQLNRKLPLNFILDEDVDNSLRALFNSKITGIIFDSDNPDRFIGEICDEAEKNKCISEASKKTVVSNSRKIAFVGKNSLFSKSVFDGIQHVFSASQHIVDSFLLNDSETLPIEYAFKDCLKRLISSDYSGVIVRPIGKMDDSTFALFKDLCIYKDVVLCDVDITKEQRQLIPLNRSPSYVCSDFELGGTKIASVVNQYCFNKGYMNSDVVICCGPTKNGPASVRSEALVKSLTTNLNLTIHKVFLNSLKPEDCFDRIKNFLEKTSFNNIKNRNLIIYLGNDNVALYFSKHLSDIVCGSSTIADYGSICILGYDGIVGTTGNSVLEESPYNYATVDTLPNDQGKIAAETLIKEIENKCDGEIVKVTPKVIKRFYLKPTMENKLSSIDDLLTNATLFILDLDGTIADTETLHWEAYDIVMKKTYGFSLRNENIKNYIGNSEVSIYRMIEKDYSIKIDDDYFLKTRLDEYLKLVEKRKLSIFKWANDFFNNYKDKKIVLLTSQVPQIVDHLLTFWGLDSIIPNNMRISAHNGKITKKEFFEHPEKFVNLGNKELGDIVVFEDSNHVAKLASDLGYTTIGISHRFNKNKLIDFTSVIDKSIKKGLFVGLSGLDAVFYINGMPEKNQKTKTNRYDIAVGGPALKAAITCSKLGGNATLITGLGNGPLSYQVRKECEKYGIEIIDIMPSKTIPNISFVGIDLLTSTRDIVSGQTISDEKINIPESFYKKFDYCLYDCNLPHFTNELVDNLQLYDIPLVLDCGSWKDNIEVAIRHSQCIISSSTFKSQNDQDVFELQKTFAIPKAAKTNGGDPIEINIEGKFDEVSVLKKNNVNTLGAGDVLHGAFCYFYFDKGMDFKSSIKNASDIATSYVS